MIDRDPIDTLGYKLIASAFGALYLGVTVMSRRLFVSLSSLAAAGAVTLPSFLAQVIYVG